MEILYFVAEAYRYKESKKWEWSIKGAYSTVEEAKQQFHARMAAITKASNDHSMVIVYDSYGNRIMADFVNTYEPEPEPEEEE